MSGPRSPRPCSTAKQRGMQGENPWGREADLREILDEQELFGHVSRTVKTFFVAIGLGRRKACVRLLDLGHVAM